MKKRKLFSALILAGMATVALASCADDNVTPSTQPTTQVTSTPTSTQAPSTTTSTPAPSTTTSTPAPSTTTSTPAPSTTTSTPAPSTTTTKPTWTTTYEPVADAVQISNVEEFLQWRNELIAGNAQNAVLLADIDLAGYDVPTFPTNTNVFSGIFDGYGHTIKNAAVTPAQNKQGFLFGTLKDATVRNLRLDSIQVNGGAAEAHAVLAGLASGEVTISNVEFTSCSVTGGNYAAIVIGRNDQAGNINFQKLTIKNSCTVVGQKYTGVVCGDVQTSSTINVTDCDLSVKVENTGGQLGAVLGRVRGGVVSFKNIILREVEAITASNKAGLFFDGAAVATSISMENIFLMNAKLTAVKQSSLLDGAGSSAKDTITTYANIFALKDGAVYTENGSVVALPSKIKEVESVDEAWYFDTLGLSRDVWEFDGEYAKILGTSPNKPGEGATITSLTLVTAGAQKSFKVGDEFNADGLIVKANYSDGVQLPLKAGEYTVDASAVNVNASGQYTVNVVVGELTASYDVFVTQVEEMKVSELTIDNLLIENEAFDASSLVVIGTLTDGTKVDISADVVITNDIQVGVDGNYTVTVSYDEGRLVETYSVAVVSSKLSESNAVVNVDASAVNGSIVDGVVTFTTIQAAVDYVQNSGIAAAVVKTINVAPGTYNEKITVSAPNVHLIGAGMDTTKISYSLAAGHFMPNLKGTWGTDGSAIFTVTGAATGFTAEGIMFENSYDYLNDKTIADKQALALLCQADQAAFYNCGFTSYQDTLETKGASASTGSRQYFKDCYIAGAVDFIFGTNATTVFDNCEIKSLARGVAQSNGGYIVAPQGCYGTAGTGTIEYGYIFLNCTLTAEEGVLDGSVGLGRPWRTDAMAAFINCEMGVHISTLEYPGSAQSRWEEMNGDSPAVARFYEYGTTGAGAITEAVVGGSILTAEQAALYTLENIFAATNGAVSFVKAWDPNSTNEDENGGVEIPEITKVNYSFNGETFSDAINHVFDQEINGTVGTFGDITIDGTVGKVVARGSDAQLNAGAKLTFDVEAGTTIIVKNHPGYNAYTINGEAAASDENTVVFNEATTVVIEATDTAYLWSITVIPGEPESPVLPDNGENGGEETPVLDPVTFDCTTLTGVTDKGEITSLGSDFFLIEGTVTTRGNDSCTSVEVAKNGTGAIYFELTQAATITIKVGSTSKDKNISFFSLRSETINGTAIANNEAIVAVACDTTITYTLAAGKYYLTAAAFDGIDVATDDNTTTALKTDGTEMDPQGNKTISGRAIRVYNITVEYTQE